MNVPADSPVHLQHPTSEAGALSVELELPAHAQTVQGSALTGGKAKRSTSVRKGCLIPAAALRPAVAHFMRPRAADSDTSAFTSAIASPRVTVPPEDREFRWIHTVFQPSRWIHMVFLETKRCSSEWKITTFDILLHITTFDILSSNRYQYNLFVRVD